MNRSNSSYKANHYKIYLRIVAVILCVSISIMFFLPQNIYSGLFSDTVVKPNGIEDDVSGTIADNAFGNGAGLAGDTLIEAGTEGLNSANAANNLVTGGSRGGEYINAIRNTGGAPSTIRVVGGSIIKYGGFFIGAYDTTKDTYELFTKPSEHSTAAGKFVDKSLALTGTVMGWASIIGTAVVILTVTATAPATGTVAAVTAPIFGVYAAGVAVTRAVVNTETVRNIEDLMAGKKKLVFAPFERPGIKEGRDIIKEELGFDPYDRSFNEIPNPNTGIPVYKPNIYIYSSKDMTVNVQVHPSRFITASIPFYNELEGWTANITGGSINGRGDFLFYEAEVPDEGFQKNTGSVINAKTLVNDLEQVVTAYGFNDREKKDFIEYWSKVLNDGRDYYAYPQTTKIVDNIMPLDIKPAPGNVFRIWFYFAPKDGKSVPAKPYAEKIVRGDYTVVEWGGLIGK